jgi:signal transduction histidine kinase
VVDDLLDLSSLHGGQVGLACGAFSPQRVAQDVIALLRPRAERKGLSLLFWCRAMPERLLGDSIRLQQVVMKLLSHAIDSTTRGEVRLELSALPQPDGRWRLQGTIADAGAGPDAAQRHRPEGPFAGEAAGTAFREVSSGLGLAVCTRLLALMGGTLGVDSRPGKARVCGSKRCSSAKPPPARGRAHRPRWPACGCWWSTTTRSPARWRSQCSVGSASRPASRTTRGRQSSRSPSMPSTSS